MKGHIRKPLLRVVHKERERNSSNGVWHIIHRSAIVSRSDFLFMCFGNLAGIHHHALSSLMNNFQILGNFLKIKEKGRRRCDIRFGSTVLEMKNISDGNVIKN